MRASLALQPALVSAGSAKLAGADRPVDSLRASSGCEMSGCASHGMVNPIDGDLKKPSRLSVGQAFRHATQNLPLEDWEGSPAIW